MLHCRAIQGDYAPILVCRPRPLDYLSPHSRELAITVPSVCALVLTYNRVELLATCLAAIEAQSRRCDRVIVVNNGSTDGTAEVLRSLAPRVEVVSIAQNCGAAGGFNRALAAGHATGADLLWLMDDDVIPEATALAELLAARDVLTARGMDPPFLASVAHSPDGSMTNVPDLDGRRRVRGYPQWPELLERGLVPIRRGTFVSALFTRETVARYGLPLADMYMWGEDTEYTLRITRTASGYLVGQSHVAHLRAQPGSLDIRTETDPRRIALHRVHVRNLVYTARRHFDRKRKLHTVLRLARLAASLAVQRRLGLARIVALGLFQGLTFSPRAPGPACPPADPAPDPANDTIAPDGLAIEGGL